MNLERHKLAHKSLQCASCDNKHFRHPLRAEAALSLHMPATTCPGGKHQRSCMQSPQSRAQNQPFSSGTFLRDHWGWRFPCDQAFG